MPIEKLNVSEQFALITEYWQPRIAASLNGQHVRMAKLKGEFIWHRHDDEDEMFYVVRGRLVIRFRDGEVALNEGELCVVPRGVEHLPLAEKEVHVLLFEPAETRNTGNIQNERTVDNMDTI